MCLSGMVISVTPRSSLLFEVAQQIEWRFESAIRISQNARVIQ